MHQYPQNINKNSSLGEDFMDAMNQKGIYSPQNKNEILQPPMAGAHQNAALMEYIDGPIHDNQEVEI